LGESALLGPYELIFLAVVILIVFGPKKLPELAQAVGKAVSEYRKASEGILSAPQQLASAITSPASPAKESQASSGSAGTLIDLAKRLNIDTAGKTSEEISAEILKKIRGEEATKASAPATST